jgi:selenocysteine lyase/cysteine desulfurase
MEMLWNGEHIVARSVDPLDSVRVSIHHFNTEAEVDLLVEAVQRIAEHHLSRTSRV